MTNSIYAYLAMSILVGVFTAVGARAEDDWWSRQALKLPDVPPATQWCRNEIDSFILTKLVENGLKPALQADPIVLIRRLTHDLTGLPPEPEEIRNFLADYRKKPDKAYEALVDRLLASPRYGERFARHWLDVAKYADTCGYDKDKLRPNAWPYRDYAIRSFNEDMPSIRIRRMVLLVWGFWRLGLGTLLGMSKFLSPR